MKNLPANAGDVGSIPGLGRSPADENGSLCQYACLVNPMNRGAWKSTVHGITESRTWLRDQITTPTTIVYCGGRPVHCQMLCCCLLTQPCVTLCDTETIAHQAPLSVEFSRQEYWSGLSCPSPGVRYLAVSLTPTYQILVAFADLLPSCVK